MKFIFGLVLVVAALGQAIVFPQQVSAHLFGGPPFLSLNGKDALTNPVYMSLPAFTMPQDNAQTAFLVNQPIQLKVDFTKLPVPAEIAEKSTFRWYWDEGADTPTYGATEEHTYNKIGSHLITLDVLAPGETDYLNLDTVRVNIVPRMSYHLPRVSIAAMRGQFVVNKSISFLSKATADPSTKIASYIWDFGDNTTSKAQNPSHVFTQSDFLNFVYVRAVDGNGFIAEDGVTAMANKGAIHLSPLTATGSSIPLVDQSSASRTSSFWKHYAPLVIAGVVVMIVIGLLLFGLLKQRPPGRKMV